MKTPLTAWLGVWCVMMFSAAASAAPILRLLNSVVTVEAPVGATPASQTLLAFNIGDGTLSPAVSVPAAITWLAVTVGAPQACGYPGGTCNTIQFTFNTASLPAGTYTASLTVSAPNAIDSPQVLIATLQIGPVPVNRYLNPGASAVVPLSSYSICYMCSASASTASGGGWLSIVLASAETFSYATAMRLAPPANMAPGTYTGNVAVFGPVAENIPVTMQVTTLPIAVPSATQITLQLAEDGPAATYPFLPYISLSNSGMGTLQVTGVSASGTGVTAYNDQGLAIVTVDPGSLAPGTYTDGLVTIQCNAANCPIQVPVSLEIDPQGPPTINYQGAVDNATFSPTGSPGDVMIVKGQQLSLTPPQYASGTPLPTTLGGASVLVDGVATPLYYSSLGQIAFQVPAATSPGTAFVQVLRDGEYGNMITANIAQYAPGIVVVTDTSYNVVDATHPATVGETLVFWALGLGPTNPVTADGAAAQSSPPASVTVPVTVAFGGNEFGPQYPSTPSFAGLSPGSVGLYQVIATVPTGVPKGNASAFLLLPNYLSSNTVTIAVQ